MAFAPTYASTRLSRTVKGGGSALALLLGLALVPFAVEFYSGGATTPPQFNATSSACGVLLLWTRER